MKKINVHPFSMVKWSGLILLLTILNGCNSTTSKTIVNPTALSSPTSSPSLSPTIVASSPVTPTVPAPNQVSPSPSVKLDEKPFRFIVMGDSRGSSNGTNEKILRDLMKQVKAESPSPSFLLFTGDQVSGGADVSGQLSSWINIVDDYFPITTIFPSLGNHEHDEKAFSQAFPSLPNEQLKGYGRTAYSFDYGNTRFITLNSNRKNIAQKYIITAEQKVWLEIQLKTNPKQHTFVQFHVPPYPNGAHLGGSLDAEPVSRDDLWAIFDRYNVTAVLVGHEHNYNRRKVNNHFNGNGYSFANEIFQLTIGGAGAPLYSANKENKQVVVGPKATYHYMVVDINGKKASFKVFDLLHNELDSFVVER